MCDEARFYRRMTRKKQTLPRMMDDSSFRWRADCARIGFEAQTPDFPGDRERRLDVRKPVEVSFTEVCAATRQASEDGRLVFADRRLAAVLMPTERGWFMQAGFGPCDHEAMFFDNLHAAAEWVRECFAAAASAIGSGARNVASPPLALRATRPSVRPAPPARLDGVCGSSRTPP